MVNKNIDCHEHDRQSQLEAKRVLEYQNISSRILIANILYGTLFNSHTPANLISFNDTFESISLDLKSLSVA